jgi:thiamine pyrophosphate-dependent acetolactate synthase large subunit-like protein
MKKLEEIERPVRTGNAVMEWSSDAIAAMLSRLGIDYVTMNPGASYRGFHDSLVNYLGNAKPQMLLCLEEDHVVSIAHGYARAVEKPMGCILHSNVGLMHGLMQIFNAYCNRAPIFIMGATGPVDADVRRPWIDWMHTAQDQGLLLRHFTKWDNQPASIPATFEAMLRAYQIARTAPMGPTYICLDAGMQEVKLDAEPKLPDPALYEPGPAPQPSPATLRAIADMLLSAQRPLILMGRVSRTPDSWDRRLKLAEALGARVLTDIKNGAAFPTDHPLHPYPPRGHLQAGAKDLLQEADVVLALDWVDLGGTIKLLNLPTALAAKIINCSVDSYIHNGWSMDHHVLPPADLRVLAEPDAVVEALLPLIETGMPGRAKKWPGRAAVKGELSKIPEGTDRPITQPDLAQAMTDARNKGHNITLMRVCIGWAGDRYHFRTSLDYLGYDGGGGLGAGPGMAIGAALALRGSGRIVASVIGDGDFLQGATSLWTAAHYRIPVLIVIANNRSNFNDEVHQAEVARERGRPLENKWIGMRIDDPAVDLVALAKAQGCEAAGPVERVADLPAALDTALRAVAAGSSYLLDVRVVPGYAAPLLTRATPKGSSEATS